VHALELLGVAPVKLVTIAQNCTKLTEDMANHSVTSDGASLSIRVSHRDRIYRRAVIARKREATCSRVSYGCDQMD
jgi:hypothetical protein